MCGFVTFFSSESALDPRFQTPVPWIGLIRHRGPDGQRSYTEEGAAMHFTRLSIIDLSDDGMQPMHSSCGRYVMTFNGEIANFKDLAAQYNLSLKGRSDSEVLLELYRILGLRVGRVIRGMFSFVVFDRITKTVVGLRDPFGIKPLYYAVNDGNLILSSEIKPILVALGGSEIDEDQVVRFLRRGEIDDGDRTLFARVKQVPPGHGIAWREGRLSIQRYREDRLSCPTLDEEAERDAYYKLLLRTAKEYLYADVPVGVSLSGGFDSSLLAHLVKAHSGSAVPRMFTRGYKDYEGNELEAAGLVAEHFGFDFHPVVLAPEEVPSRLMTCSEQQEHPVTSISVLAFHKLYEEARSSGIKVLLEGHGGDEIWAGYSYYLQPDSGLCSHDGSTFKLNEEILLDQFRSAQGRPAEAPSDGFNGSPLTRRQMDDLFGWKLQRSLRFVDRASMRYQIEVRVPFLDTDIVYPALSLPDNWKIRNGQLRSFVREMARKVLPDSVALRPKIPIQDPQRKWLRGELKEFVSDLLLSSPLFIEQFVDVPRLRQTYRNFLANPDRFDNLTFLVFPVFLEAWYRALKRSLATQKEVPCG